MDLENYCQSYAIPDTLFVCDNHKFVQLQFKYKSIGVDSQQNEIKVDTLTNFEQNEVKVDTLINFEQNEFKVDNLINFGQNEFKVDILNEKSLNLKIFNDGIISMRIYLSNFVYLNQYGKCFSLPLEDVLKKKSSLHQKEL